MTLPIRDDDDPTPPGSAGRGGRPDWLTDTNDGLGQSSPGPAPSRPASTPPRPPTPVAPTTPAAPAAHAAPDAPAAPEKPAAPARPAAPERIEGLVGPEIPDAAPPSVLGDRNQQLGVDPTSLATSAVARFRDGQAPAPRTKFVAPPPVVTTPPPPPASSITPASPPAFSIAPSTTPGEHREVPSDASHAPVASSAWSAAASSIPSLRSTRKRAVPAEEEWDDEEFSEPRSAPAEAHAPVAAPRPVIRRKQDPLATVLRFAARVPMQVYSIAAGALVALAIVLVIVWPKEHFTSIRQIKAHAREMDGQIVRIRGTTGQSFAVGGGYAFYLHQSRDTIVVFTRNRTPVERKRIKLMGTVSTGFLDGAARAAIFEDPTPSN